MNYISVCAGIEAFSEAVKEMDYHAVAFAEIDKAASAVLLHHHPDVPNAGDFTAIRGDEYDAVDLLVGGTPCQDFSVAGLRKGLGGERGGLTIEFARLAHRLAARARTRWLLWENVPGVLSIDDGRAFAIFLSAMCGRLVQIPKDGWQNSGIVEGTPQTFGLAYRVLDAQYAGVPQRRRRVFVVGYFGDWRRAAAVLFERHSLSRNSPPRREAGKGLTRDVAPSITGSGTGFRNTGESRGQDPVVATYWDGTDVADTLDASNASKQQAMPENRRFQAVVTTGTLTSAGGPAYPGQTVQDAMSGLLHVTHSLRADGFDASEDGTGRGTPLVPVAFNNTGEGWWNEAESAATVRKGDDAGGGGARESTLIAFSSKDHGADAGDLSPTLRSMGHDGSHANGGGQVAVAMNLRGREGGAMPELDDVASLRAASGGSSRSYLATTMAVRRLTPRECERLQRFPDDYTLITPKTADGPRYKMLGNSMAVPVMRWIGERIAMVEAIQ